MATSEAEIDSFARFAKGELARRGEGVSLEELFDQWRIRHPPAEDARAIQASIRDMEQGEAGRPLDEFADDFRRRNNLRESP
jgi:hypothetical protein